MNTIDDMTLIAYVDGELDTFTIHEVEAALAQDAILREKVRQLRESTAMIGTAFNHALYGKIHEFNPELVTIEKSSSTNIVPLSSIRSKIDRFSEKPQQLRPRSALTALAASVAVLLLGGVAGHYLTLLQTSPDNDRSLLTTSISRHDEPEWQAAFNQGLENELSGTPVAWKNTLSGNEGTVTPTRTFQTKKGQYCREFEEIRMINGMRHSEGGVACRRDDGAWQVRARFYPE